MADWIDYANSTTPIDFSGGSTPSAQTIPTSALSPTSAEPAAQNYSGMFGPASAGGLSYTPSQSNASNPDTPWYKNPIFAQTLAESAKGVMQYLDTAQKEKAAMARQKDFQDFQTQTINNTVSRASAMPLLRRVTKDKGAK